jgi:hypothetical protein
VTRIKQPLTLKSLKNKEPKVRISKTNDITSILVPKNITKRQLQGTLSAYQSNISNMFTDTDPTVTEQGYMRMFTDTGYYGDVIKALTIYDQDDLVAGMIDSIINACNTDIKFNVKKTNSKEKEIWDKWKKIINTGMKNILPGSRILNEKIFSSLVKTGMSVIDFEWGDVMVGRKTYKLPTKIVQYPVLGTKLRASVNNFGDEDVLVSVSKAYFDTFMQAKDNDVSYKNLFVDIGDTKLMIKKNAYAVKYKHDGNAKTLYPVPMLKRSFESIALRHKLLDSDMSTLELVINRIIQVKVGDKDNIPQDNSIDEDGNEVLGDLELAQETFGALKNNIEVITTPYYYEIHITNPNTETLRDRGKYTQSTINILSNFGIVIDPSGGADNKSLELLNIKSYKNLCVSLQNHVAAWYSWLCLQIIQKNMDKIKEVPDITFGQPDLHNPQTLQFFKELTNSGFLDIPSLLEESGFSPDIVEDRLIQQKKREEENEGLYEARATFKQVVSNTDANNNVIDEKETGVKKTRSI